MQESILIVKASSTSSSRRSSISCGRSNVNPEREMLWQTP